MGAAELLAVLMVAAVCALLFAGYPVALTLGGVSLAFGLIGSVIGAMDFLILGALPQRIPEQDGPLPKVALIGRHVIQSQRVG